MIPNPTEEIKAIRHRLGAELDYDLGRIIADIRQRQKESGRTYLRLPKREPQMTMQGFKAAKSDGSAEENLSSPPSDRKR